MSAKSLGLSLWLLGGFALCAAEYPPPEAHDVTLHNFHFQTGETLPELKIHFISFGAPHADAQGVVRNAVMILHGTTGSCSNFIRPDYAGELFAPGQLLDASKYYIILPDGIGHGHSSKPSDGLHARFPHYGYHDMVEAQYRLLTEGLHVNHLRLLIGTSMGGMHTWIWGETHPDFMDALMPLATAPGPISGRNRVWRRIIIDSIRGDPSWNNGEYQAEPPSLRVAAETLYFMANNPLQRYRDAPTLEKSDEQLDAAVAQSLKTLDANDALYALQASQDYDPGPDLEKIKAPLLAINSADDLINPPEIGVLDREIRRVKRGKMVMIPYSGETRGHQTHTLPVLWRSYLADLLQESEPTPSP